MKAIEITDYESHDSYEYLKKMFFTNQKVNNYLQSLINMPITIGGGFTDNRTLKHKLFDTLTEGIATRLDIQRRELSIEFGDGKLYVYHGDTILREWTGEHPYMECFYEDIQGYGIYFHLDSEARVILRPLLDGSTPDYFNEVMKYYHDR